MEKFTYPAVIYNDTDLNIYVLLIPDLNLVVEGDSVEEVHLKAKSMLEAYLDCACVDGETEIPKPSKFNEVAEKYKKQICVLVEGRKRKNNNR